MRRREFITLLGSAAAAWPLAARAQQSERLRRIGVLMAYTETNSPAQRLLVVFREALAKLGWIEGRNLRIDYRWATTDPKLIEQCAKELVALSPALILSSSSPTTAALQRETRSIPIIFAIVVDPVGQGFIASLAKPGGNITGFINLETSITGKFVELLKEIAPSVSRAAIFFNPATAPYFEMYLAPFKAAASSFGVEAIVAAIRDMAELDVFAKELAQKPNGGLIVMPDSFSNARSAEIAALATRHGLPAVASVRQFAEAGGLLSFGSETSDNYRRAANYVDRILKGERPSDLPAQFPVKFELVINLKAAKALGLNVPWQLQQRADEVFE